MTARIADFACVRSRRVPLVAAVIAYLVAFAIASAAVSIVRGCAANPRHAEIAR